MNLKIVFAGAASALLVGTFAVAQTTSAPNDTTAPDATTSDTMNNQSTGAVNDQSNMGATGAEAYGTDTAAQTGDMGMAGERG